jgi:hypothetical protein
MLVADAMVACRESAHLPGAAPDAHFLALYVCPTAGIAAKPQVRHMDRLSDFLEVFHLPTAVSHPLQPPCIYGGVDVCVRAYRVIITQLAARYEIASSSSLRFLAHFASAGDRGLTNFRHHLAAGNHFITQHHAGDSNAVVAGVGARRNRCVEKEPASCSPKTLVQQL